MDSWLVGVYTAGLIKQVGPGPTGLQAEHIMQGWAVQRHHLVFTFRTAVHVSHRIQIKCLKNTDIKKRKQHADKKTKDTLAVCKILEHIKHKEIGDVQKTCLKVG